MDVSNARQLSAAIEGRTDEQIISIVIQMGVDVALDKVFQGMTRAFLPGQAAGERAVIQWNVHVGGSTHTYQLNVANGTCKAAKGAPAKPRLALTAGLPTFFRVITGQSSSRMAVFTGKLKVEGSIMFALAQENWFDKNWAG